MAGGRRREVDVAALVKHMLTLRRFTTHFRRLATNSLGFPFVSVDVGNRYSVAIGAAFACFIATQKNLTVVPSATGDNLSLLKVDVDIS